MNTNIYRKYNKSFLTLYSLTFFMLFLIMDSQLNSVFNTKFFKAGILILAALSNLFIMMYNKKSLTYYLEISLPFCFLIIPVFFPGTALISSPVFVISLFMFNSYNISTEELVKTDLRMRIFFCIFVMVMYFTHLFPANSYSVAGVRNGITRYGLGFNSGNSLAMFVFTIMFSYILYKKDSIFNFSKIFCFIFIIFVTFKITDSREFLILGIVTVVFLIIGRFSFVKIIIHYLVPVAIFASLFVGLIFIINSDLSSLYSLNVLTSNRIAIQYEASLYYPIRLLGYASVELLDIHKLNIDNMYMAYLVHYGIIGFSLFSYLFIKAYFISRKLKNVFIDFVMIVVPLSLITLNADFVLFPLIYIYSKKK